MRSPLCGFLEGSTGKSRHSHEPVLRAGELADGCGSVRVLMKAGKWLEPKGERPMLRPIPDPPPTKRKRSFASEVRGFNRSELRGRPAHYAALKPEIVKLRAEGCTWPEVGRRLKIHPEAARMVVTKRTR